MVNEFNNFDWVCLQDTPLYLWVKNSACQFMYYKPILMCMGKLKNHKLLVTGYENDDIESFVKKLEDNDVKILVDVRELPLSRKKFFSKNALNEQVKRSKIQYVHYRELGSPREIRHKLKNSDMSYRDFFVAYRKHLIKNEKELQELIEMLKYSDVCLMCYEEQTSACHRTIIVDELLKLNPKLQVMSV